MANISIPDLYCPFPQALSEHALEAERSAVEWAKQVGLLDGTDVLGLGRNAVGHLSGYVHPWGSAEEVGLGAAWVAWLFAYDDALVERVREDSNVDMRAIEKFQARILAAAEGDPTAADADPLLRALGDIRETLLRLRPEWRPRAFVNDLRHFLHSNRWEIGNALRGRPPRLAAYVHMRRHTSSYYPCFRISAGLADVRLAPAVWEHVAVKQLELMANNFGSWLNDLYSFESEAAEGTLHSLVRILQQEHGCELQRAVDQVAEMCRIEVESYVELKSRLPDMGLDLDGELRRYLSQVLEPWMRGILDWHKMTPRYRRHQQTALSPAG